MAVEMLVVLVVVVPSDTATGRSQILNLHGRELAAVPGSVVTRVAVHPLPLTSGMADDAPTLFDDDAEHALDLDYGVDAAEDD